MQSDIQQMNKQKIIRWVLIVIGALVTVFVSFTVVYQTFIPDICYYHTHDMNLVMGWFYSSMPGDNGHPSPNLFNLVFSLVIGGLSSDLFYRKLIRKHIN